MSSRSHLWQKTDCIIESCGVCSGYKTLETSDLPVNLAVDCQLIYTDCSFKVLFAPEAQADTRMFEFVRYLTVPIWYNFICMNLQLFIPSRRAAPRDLSFIFSGQLLSVDVLRLLLGRVHVSTFIRTVKLNRLESEKRLRVRLCSLNPHITCKLCNGYLIEAATITECLHTFCKSCLMRHIGLVNRCPTCSTIIHETQPLYNIRLDRTMQDIVHKLLPRLDREEKRREKRFYKSRGMPYPLPSLPEVHGCPSSSSTKKNKSSSEVRARQEIENVNHQTEDQISLQLELQRTTSKQQESLQGNSSEEEEEVDVMTVSYVDKGRSLSPAVHVDTGLRSNIEEDGLLNIAIVKVYSLNKDGTGNQNARKFIHNIKEQERRKDLRSRYLKLKDVIPGLSTHGQLAKIHILTKANECIDQMIQDESRLLTELEKQKKCNEELLKRMIYLSC